MCSTAQSDSIQAPCAKRMELNLFSGQGSCLPFHTRRPRPGQADPRSVYQSVGPAAAPEGLQRSHWYFCCIECLPAPYHDLDAPQPQPPC
jgi:hypothetical protein